MNKVKAIGSIIIGVIVIYIILTAAQPAIVEVANTANVTMAASSNMSNFPGMAEATVAAPLWIYFIPGGVGLAAVIFILKRK